MIKSVIAACDEEYQGIQSFGSDEDHAALHSKRKLQVNISCLRMLTCITLLLLILLSFAFWKIFEQSDGIKALQKNQEIGLQMIRKTERVQARQQLEYNKQNIPSFSKKINSIINSTVSLIDLFALNDQGNRKSQQLYQTEQQRIIRQKFNEEREYFIDKQNKSGIHLVKYNYLSSAGSAIEGLLANVAEWERLNNKYNLSDKQIQLHMCIIIPGYNNRANFRIQYNLNSVFTQNYTNYKVVIINDASTDGSDTLYRQYFEIYNISRQKYFYTLNKERVTALENIYNGILGQCQNYEIVIILDADDELIGRNVLKTLNAVYQTRNLGIVYSNFYWYQQRVKIQAGFTKQYTDEQKNKQAYRDVEMKFSQLRSFKRELFMQIDPRDMQDNSGKFYKIAYDMAMFLPMLELSCSQIVKLNENQYLYNIETGFNDYTKGNGQQQRVDLQIRAKAKYKCSDKYKNYRL